MDILNNSIQTKRVYNREEADVVVHYTTDEKIKKRCGEEATGCIALYKVPRVVYIPIPHNSKTKKETSAILFHEIGHFYGLVDQYNDLQNSSLIYSTIDRFTDFDSVMGLPLKIL